MLDYKEINDRNRKIGWLTFADRILITLFILLIAAICIGIYIYKTTSMECYNNPLVYGIKTLQSQNGDEKIQCSCSMLGKNANQIMIDENGIHNIDFTYGEMP